MAHTLVAVTTLTLTSTTGFDASGTVHIGSEQVTYTAILGNDITGCTRGANGTTAATHADDVFVAQFEMVEYLEILYVHLIIIIYCILTLIKLIP